MPIGRPISDMNSASLERQCRELWKLRATLQDDTCGPDDWSNYHQRLTRRYDSGYKSLEQQLSSSLEGVTSSIFAQNLQANADNSNSSNFNRVNQIEPDRPRSGCSNYVDTLVHQELTAGINQQQRKLNVLRSEDSDHSRKGLISNEERDDTKTPSLRELTNADGRASKCSIGSGSQFGGSDWLDVKSENEPSGRNDSRNGSRGSEDD